MAHDALRDTALVRALTDLMTDLSDLVQKEVRLARAEIAHKLNLRLQAGIWFAVAGLLGLVVALLVVEGAVFALASAGLALHWSCLLVAAILAAAAALALYYGRLRSAGDLAPTRSARQFNEAIRTAKEQLQ
jgi:Putative Actinobacterial Holin-X, holin superfamily III